MLTYMLHILIKQGCEDKAIDTLSAIERLTQADEGLVKFTWLQHEQDPYRFTLFEQWESQEHLNSHLKKNPSRWSSFEPCLVEEPRSESFRSVSALAGPPAADELRNFVRTWFAKLSFHVPVEELLSMVAAEGFEIEFPEARLTNEAEFRKWYADVGRSYHDQSHTLERIDLNGMPGSRAIDLDLVVIWKAHRTSDGAHLAFRAHHSWQIERAFTTGQLVIMKYYVLTLVEITEEI